MLTLLRASVGQVARIAATFVALAACGRCSWHDCLRLCIATSGSLILVFETTLNVPVIGSCTPAFAWGMTTLFATGNVVFPLFGNVAFPLFYFAARGCARFSFLGILACPTFWTDARSLGVRRGIASSDMMHHYTLSDGCKGVIFNPGTQSFTILRDEIATCPLDIRILCSHSSECTFQNSSIVALIYIIRRTHHPLYFG
jgi:hypothetical protein